MVGWWLVMCSQILQNTETVIKFYHPLSLSLLCSYLMDMDYPTDLIHCFQ